MKAAVLVETGKPLQIIDSVQIPELLPGQVLVRLVYAAVCHSQLMEVAGCRGEDKYLPHLLGHEGVGIVESTGAGVSKVKHGDWVILGWIKGEGSDAPGGKYQSDIGLINSGGVTTFSEQTVVSENRLTIMPEGLPPKLAVLFGCALPTGAGLVLNEAKPEAGSSIAIFGLGGIGLSCLIAASLSSPRQLIAIDVSEEKLELARELGATHVINASSENVETALMSITENKGVDYSFEASGSSKVIEQAFNSVRENGGLCVFASHPPEGDLIHLEPHAFHRGKRIQGSWGGASKPDRDIPKLASLYKEKNLPLEKLLSKTYTLDEINEAMTDLKQGRIVRALIAISPDLDGFNK